MLQRIQSLFLTFTAICMIAMVLFPIWSKQDPGSGMSHIFNCFGLYSFNPDTGERSIKYFPYAAIGLLAFISAGVAIFEVFQYQDRLRQIKIGAMNSLIMGVCLGATIYFVTELDKEILPFSKGVFHAGFYLPAAGMLSNVVANRFIKRDEKIVRDSDRMR